MLVIENHPHRPLADLTNALFDAHRDDPQFGYRFLADEVRAASVTRDPAPMGRCDDCPGG
jgi:hypothetical protein